MNKHFIIAPKITENKTFSRQKITLLLLLLCQFLCAQKVREIDLHASENTGRTLKLSEITKNIRPVVLSRINAIQSITVTDKFLFVVDLKSINMYGISGEFIRTVYSGFPTALSVACDTASGYLYVPVEKSVRQYDFDGRLVKTFNLLNRVADCRYDRGKLYLLSGSDPVVNGNEFTRKYFISELNLQTGKETEIPVKIQEKEHFEGAFAVGQGLFSATRQGLFAAFSADSIIYRIRDGKAYPSVCMHVKAGFIHKVYLKSFFIGKYLFLNVAFKDGDYLYVDDSAAGRNGNKTGMYGAVVDDIYDSGNVRIVPLNRDGHFFFSKGVSDVKKMDSSLKEKNLTALFIAEIKD